MKQPLHHDLSRRERQIMDALFALGRSGASEVVARMGEPEAYDSVRVTLGILERKGYVTHEREGNRNVYSPAVSHEKAKESALRHVTRTFFHGSPQRAILAMLDLSEDRLSEEELEEISRWIEKKSKEG